MTKESIIKKMDAFGYGYNVFNSYRGYHVFDTVGGSVSFTSWRDVEEWYKEVSYY